MMTFYIFILYIHIMSAIVSIGPFFILFPVMNRLQKESETQVVHAYLTVFRFVVQLIKHAGHIVVISGILLVVSSGWTWSTPWIVATIILLISSLFFLARAFSPILRKFKEPQENKEKLVQKLRRSTIIYLFLLLVMLALMVAKPTLW